MGTVWYNDAGTLEVAAGHMVLAYDHQACKLTVRTSERIQGKLRHTGDGRKSMSQTLIDTQGSLDSLGRLHRMQARKSRHCSDLLVDLRIVFHGAASERIESRVHTEVHL